MNPIIVVIGIDIPNSGFDRQASENETTFRGLSFENKLALIAKRLDILCQELSRIEPHADKWIVAWREFGLGDEWTEYTPNDKKNLLKKMMCEITQRFPKLTVITGSIATTRALASVNPQKLQQKTMMAKNYCTMYKRRFSENLLIVRNTAYAFANGQCVARHDKSADFDETYGLSNAVWQNAQGRNESPLIQEDIGLEICLEHSEGCLKNWVEKSSNQKAPLLQIIVSRSCSIDENKVISPHCVHIDYHRGVNHFISSDQEDTNAPIVHVYKNNLLTSDLTCQFVESTPLSSQAKVTYPLSR